MWKRSKLRIKLWKVWHWHWYGDFAVGRAGLIYCTNHHNIQIQEGEN